MRLTRHVIKWLKTRKIILFGAKPSANIAAALGGGDDKSRVERKLLSLKADENE